MRVPLRQFGRGILRLTGGSGGARAAAAGGPDPEKVALLVWAAIFVLLVIASMYICFHASLYHAEMILSALWGAFLGLTILFLLPQKLVITAFGGFLGVAGTDIAAGQIAEKLANTIKEVLLTINASLDGQAAISTEPAWIFIVLMAIPCLLAYR